MNSNIMNIEDNKKYEFLGSGAYGAVYKKKAKDGSYYAVKQFGMDDNSLIKEIVLLQCLKGEQNVISIKDFNYMKRQIKMPLYDSNLDKNHQYNYEMLIKYNTSFNQLFTESIDPEVEDIIYDIYLRRKKIIYDVISGLNSNFSNGILHRDIKPYNILIKDAEAVITDYGTSNFFTPFSNNDTKVYSISQRPPEIYFNFLFYSYSADIWAFGLTLFSLLTGVYLSEGISDMIAVLGEDELGELLQFIFVNQLKNLGYKDNIIEKLGKQLLNYKTELSFLNSSDDIEKYLKKYKSSYDYRILNHYDFILRKLLRFLEKSKSSKIPLLEVFYTTNKITKEELDLLRYILKFNPEKRPSPEQIYLHSYFDDIRNPDIIEKYNIKPIIFPSGSEEDIYKLYSPVILSKIYKQNEVIISTPCKEKEPFSTITDYIGDNLTSDFSTLFIYVAEFICNIREKDYGSLIFILSIFYDFSILNPKKDNDVKFSTNSLSTEKILKEIPGINLISPLSLIKINNMLKNQPNITKKKENIIYSYIREG